MDVRFGMLILGCLINEVEIGKFLISGKVMMWVLYIVCIEFCGILYILFVIVRCLDKVLVFVFFFLGL